MQLLGRISYSNKTDEYLTEADRTGNWQGCFQGVEDLVLVFANGTAGTT